MNKWKFHQAQDEIGGQRFHSFLFFWRAAYDSAVAEQIMTSCERHFSAFQGPHWLTKKVSLWHFTDVTPATFEGGPLAWHDTMALNNLGLLSRRAEGGGGKLGGGWLIPKWNKYIKQRERPYSRLRLDWKLGCGVGLNCLSAASLVTTYRSVIAAS